MSAVTKPPMLDETGKALVGAAKTDRGCDRKQ